MGRVTGLPDRQVVVSFTNAFIAAGAACSRPASFGSKPASAQTVTKKNVSVNFPGVADRAYRWLACFGWGLGIR